MYEVVVKSQTKNRLRLKSKSFKGKKLQEIIELLSNKNLKSRVNEACNSIIIYYDTNKINANEILELFNAKSQIPKEVIDKTCNICNTEISKTAWKQKLIEFGALSGFAIYAFVKENILLSTLPFPLVAGISLMAAIPLLKESFKDIKQKNFSLQTFMSFSLILALIGGEATAAFEIIYILRASMLFEEYTAEKSKKEIHKLIETDSKKAYILNGDLEVEVELKSIKEGDIVVSRSGEKIPIDGIIIDGQAEIDESIITGRSEPTFKTKNDEVFANTLIEKGRIIIKVNAIGENTYISRVISQVEKALSYKSQGILQAERLAARVLKLGTILTIATFGLTGSFIRAFSVMIVMSCPCSTILAASSAISAAIARGARGGILIKGGKYLEEISQSDVFCFDKTGTLTTGKPEISDIICSKNTTKEELFRYAALAEYRNTHPIAISINEYAKELKVKINQNIECEILPGLGVKAFYNKKEILVGNENLLKENKISTTIFKKQIQEFLNDGKSIVFVAYDNSIKGIIAFTHQVRDKTHIMTKGLKKRGIQNLLLLTGDDEKVANVFARNYGFDKVYSNLMPEDKANVIKELKKDYKKIVMIGDGVNDTLAMGYADIGISFASGGSEAAIEVSNIAIANSDPEDILKLYDLSKNSLRTINQNYWIGTSTNIVGVLLAGFGLLSPVAAGALHIVHTAGIIANSSLITFKR